MSSRSFKTKSFKRYTGNGGRRHASRATMYAAMRKKYSYVPRTPAGMVVTERKYFDSFLKLLELITMIKHVWCVLVFRCVSFGNPTANGYAVRHAVGEIQGS